MLSQNALIGEREVRNYLYTILAQGFVRYQMAPYVSLWCKPNC